jgi:cytochrome c oxidase subunit II
MRRVMAVAIVLATVAVAAMGDSSLHAGEPARDVHVVARKFGFEPAVIAVTTGERVRLLIRSADTVHGFQIRGLNIDLQVPKSGEAVAEFTAPPPGRYEIACSEFCGSGHGQMRAVLVSVAPTQTGR